jgi:undecaprenyl diphosphate synthase
VLAVEAVDGTFHARFGAKEKRYAYHLILGPAAVAVRGPLRLAHPASARRRGDAAELPALQGRHDFAAFQSTGSDIQDTVRTLTEARLDADPAEDGGTRLVLTLAGDGFLRHMVRAITGSLVEVGRGRWTAGRLAAILASADRSQAGPTAPPARACSWCRFDTAKIPVSHEPPDVIARLPPGSPEALLARQIDGDRLPAHVAIIMDGNGRWAAQRHLPRVEGHRSGIASVREAVETSARLGIPVLTLYAFSIENWKRPRTEVSALMALLRRYLRSELHMLMEHGIRFRVVGRKDALSPEIQKELSDAERATAAHTGMQFNIALNYGGRAEIVDAVRAALAAGHQAGRDRRGALRRPALHGRATRSRSPDPDRAARCGSATSCSGRSPTPRSG